MKESYGEGIASHSGHEPCEGGREAALEALDRSICRLGIELRNDAAAGRPGHDEALGSGTTGETARPTTEDQQLKRLVYL